MDELIIDVVCEADVMRGCGAIGCGGSCGAL